MNINILAFQNPKGYTDIKQVEEEIVGTTSAVKFIMGVPVVSFDEILEANNDVLKRLKKK